MFFRHFASRFLPGMLLLLAACHSPEPVVEPLMPGLPTEIGQPAGAVTSQVIGPEGGSLILPDGRLILTIPPGALSKPTTITVQPIENKAPGGAGQAYRFGPEGTPLAKPAQLSWHYAAEDLRGSTPEALGIASQGRDRVWMGRTNVALLPETQTVTASLPQFGDWTFFEQFYMTPTSGVLSPGETVQLDVFVQTGRAKADPSRPNSSDQVVPLVVPWKLNRSQIRNWRVNGEPLDGRYDDRLGGLSLLNEGASAVYKAPDRVPSRTNPIAVSVELVRPGSQQVLFVSTRFIVAASEPAAGVRP